MLKHAYTDEVFLHGNVSFCFITNRRVHFYVFPSVYIYVYIYRFSILPFKCTRNIVLREAIRSRPSGIYRAILFSHRHHRVWNAILRECLFISGRILFLSLDKIIRKYGFEKPNNEF